MSAGKLSTQNGNRERTPARFFTLQGDGGPVILNTNFVINCMPLRNPMESEDGKYNSNINMINGQALRVKETTTIIAQILSADGLHGNSR